MLYYGSFYGGYNVNKVGRPIGMIYGYKKLGIFNTQAEIDGWAKQDGVIPGGMKFADTNGDGVVSYDTQDMVEIGNPNPDFTCSAYDHVHAYWGATHEETWKTVKKLDFNGIFKAKAIKPKATPIAYQGK